MSSALPALALPQQGTSGYEFILMAAIGLSCGAVAAYGGWMACAGLLFVGLLIRWPVQIALGSFLFLIPFDSVAIIGSESTGPTLTRDLGGLVAFVLLAVGFSTRRLSRPPLAALWFSLFVFWGIVSLWWTENPDVVWERVPTACSLLLIYLVLCSFRIRVTELAAVSVFAVVGGCIAAAMVSSDFYRGILFRNTLRLSLELGGRDTDPNGFAASLLIPLALAIGGVVALQFRAARWVSGIGGFLVAFAILLSMSRGALIALMAVVLAFLYRLGFNRKLLIGIGFVGALLWLMPQEFFSRLSLADRGAGRFDIWMASLQLLPRYAWLGAGWDNFPIAYTSVSGSAPHFHGYFKGSHSIYLGMLVEEGIVGLSFLLLAFRSHLREASQKSLIPYEAACWGILAMGFTLDIVWRKYFWVCWALLAMAARALPSAYDENSPELVVHPTAA